MSQYKPLSCNCEKEIQLLMTAEQIARAQEMSTNLFNRINTPPTK